MGNSQVIDWSKKCIYLVAYATLFDLLFSQADIDTSTFFTYSNFAWGLHGGVDVMWCGGLFVLDLH
jgi:hypothetical protein